MENRLGKIRISESVLYSEFAKKLFSEFIPISIVQDYYDPRIAVYIGFSDKFEEIKEGFEIPFYTAEITSIEEIQSLKFEKQCQ